MIFPGNFLNAFGFFNVVDNYLSVFDPAFLLSSYFAVKLGTSGFINLLPTWCLIQFRYLIQDPVILIKAKDFRFQSVPNKKKNMWFFLLQGILISYTIFSREIFLQIARSFFFMNIDLPDAKNIFGYRKFHQQLQKMGTARYPVGIMASSVAYYSLF